MTLIPGDGECRTYVGASRVSNQGPPAGIGPEISEAVKAIYAAAKVIIRSDMFLAWSDSVLGPHRVGGSQRGACSQGWKDSNSSRNYRECEEEHCRIEGYDVDLCAGQESLKLSLGPLATPSTIRSLVFHRGSITYHCCSFRF